MNHDRCIPLMGANSLLFESEPAARHCTPAFTGDIRRLTFDDGNDLLDAWSRDGRWLYFTSASRDVSGMNDVFRVNVDGGTPMQVSADRYASEYFSAPSPDGKGLALTARGNQAGQWWRKGHSHLDECEIWIRRIYSQL
jgi:hypothetical protein